MKKCNRSRTRKNIRDYKAVIFDMDGTLYSQPKLRLLMALHLISHFLRHPYHIKELWVLINYRSIREHWEEPPFETAPGSSHSSCAANESMEYRQYASTARKMNLSPVYVKETVSYWMHTYPLRLLPGCADSGLKELIDALKAQGVITAVYSDYPAGDKLEALGLHVDSVFSSGQGLNCMKPDVRGMQAVLSGLSCLPEEALMIGDRYLKDGLSAEYAGMDYLILSKFISLRRPL